LTKVTSASPGDADVTLPPGVLSASDELMAAYDELLERSEDFARLVVDQVRDEPAAVADLVQQLAGETKLVFQRWTLPILYMLSLQPRHDLRFSQIRAIVKGISGRSLSLKLDEMERSGLLDRKVSTDKPPHVSYALTARGLTLSRLSLPLVLHLNMTPAMQRQLRPSAGKE
jgi:DNA-binding HxlR family transcriptional regulator